MQHAKLIARVAVVIVARGLGKRGEDGAVKFMAVGNVTPHKPIARV
jgi:hypothetical protein